MESLAFTSALYLGLQHRSEVLRPWVCFTTGAPAALVPLVSSDRIGHAVAQLQGCEQAAVGTSTLHLFCDLFVLLPSDKFSIYLDPETYPIAKWCIDRAVVRGVEVHNIKHFAPRSLNTRIEHTLTRRLRPIVVTDGYCPGCGRLAPIPEYLEILRPYRGYLIIDDTQALGIFGCRPNANNPYGQGGGGSLRWWEVDSPNVITISSLAKGFGVPLAVLVGSAEMVRQFVNKSGTFIHCSPPSIPTLHAAQHAIRVNQESGDRIRIHLACLVRHFKQRIMHVGLQTISSIFPMQTLILPSSVDASVLHYHLLRLGTKTVLHRSHRFRTPCISFIITARHKKSEIDSAVDNLQCALRTSIRERYMPRSNRHGRRALVWD